MVRKLASLSARILVLNLVSIFVTGLVLFVWDNTVYHWIVSALMTFTLYYFVWIDASNTAQKDVQKDKIITRKKLEGEYNPESDEARSFVKWFGFAAGLLSQLPVMLLLIVSFLLSSNVNLVMVTLARAWYFTYSQLILSAENAMPYLLFLFPVALSVVAGLGYLSGPAQQKRLEVIIERNTAKKASRVQDDKKNKKKLSKKESIYRR